MTESSNTSDTAPLGIEPVREAFLKAWDNRPWLLEEETDKDRAWRWWQAALASQQGGEKAEASAQDAEDWRERLQKMADSHIVDGTTLNALGQFDATYGDLRAALRSPAAIAPAVWNDGYQANAVKLANEIRSRRHEDFTPEYQEKLLLADALMQALGVVEKLHRCASLLFQNAVGCCENHHGIDIKLNGYPGWLRDIGRDIDSVTLSSTNRGEVK